MHNVTDEQIDFILDDITKKGIVTEDVRDNILDHVCCIIEHEMPNGADFFKFYENTIARFYRKELREIEDETSDLITFKYFYAMKRTLKTTGIISGLLILVGSILKVLHLPGAGIALVLGLASFSLIFLPLNAVLKFRDEKEGKNPLLLSIGMLILATACIGFLFKIMHWPFANILIQSSIATFVLFYIPSYFVTRFRNADTKFNGTINSVFMIAACGMLFALTNNKSSNQFNANMTGSNTHLVTSVQNAHLKNSAMYADLESVRSAELVEIHERTEGLYGTIEEIEKNLIAKVQGISLEEAAHYSGELIDPYANRLVHERFTLANGPHSYSALMGQVSEYNKLALKHNLEPVDLEGMHLKENMLSVLLQNLNQIQLQILSEEYAVLNFERGRNAVQEIN